MNWILIANTAVSKIDYNTLVIAIIGITFIVIGFRGYLRARREEEVDS